MIFFLKFYDSLFTWECLVKKMGKALSCDFVKMLSLLLCGMSVRGAAYGCPTGLCPIPRDPTYRAHRRVLPATGPCGGPDWTVDWREKMVEPVSETRTCLDKMEGACHRDPRASLHPHGWMWDHSSIKINQNRNVCYPSEWRDPDTMLVMITEYINTEEEKSLPNRRMTANTCEKGW